MGPGSFVPVGATELGCAGLASPLPRSHVPKLFVPGLPINCSCQAWPPGQRPGPLSRCTGAPRGPGDTGDPGLGGQRVPVGSQEGPALAQGPPALSRGVLYPSCHPCLAPGPCLLGVTSVLGCLWRVPGTAPAPCVPPVPTSARWCPALQGAGAHTALPEALGAGAGAPGGSAAQTPMGRSDPPTLQGTGGAGRGQSIDPALKHRVTAAGGSEAEHMETP